MKALRNRSFPNTGARRRTYDGSLVAGYLLMTVLLGLFLAIGGQAAVTPIPAEDRRAWLDYLIPLPHEIAIAGVKLLPPGEIGIVTRSGAGEVEKQAAQELRDLFQAKSGVLPEGKGFKLRIGVLDDQGRLGGYPVEQAARLKSLPNPDQAYLIQPAGTNALVVAGWNEKGVYYGAQTLRQLLGSKLSPSQATIPMVTVVDWPDLDERGFWNNDLSLIPWMATLKLNFAHLPMPIAVNKRGAKAWCPTLPTNTLAAARVRAFRLIPHIAHYDYWRGPYQVYPELIGKGDQARNPAFPDRYRCPCASNPLFAQLIADWLESAAAQGARELSLWLTEYTPCQCECAACLAHGRKQWRTETQASVRAWQIARKQFPDLVVRIFFTLGAGRTPEQTTQDIQDAQECLAVLPPEIKVEKVYGGAREPFDAYAAKGRWVASYNCGEPLPRSFNSGLGFNTASKTRKDALDYQAHHWSGVYCCSYFELPSPQKGIWERALFSYSFASLAEWSWNTKGRSLQQFAAAWATCQGYDHPEAVAEWVTAIEPLENVLNPMQRTLGRWAEAVRLLAARQLADKPLTFVPSRESSEKALADCDRAGTLAASIAEPSLALETRYVRAACTAAKEVRTLADALQRREPGADKTGPELSANVTAIIAALNDMTAIMNQRVDLVKTEPKTDTETIKINHAEMCREAGDQITQAVAALGSPHSDKK